MIKSVIMGTTEVLVVHTHMYNDVSIFAEIKMTGKWAPVN